MKTFNQLFVAGVVILGSVSLTTQQCSAAIPSGTVTYDVTDEANVLWDVTRIPELSNLYVGIADIQSDIWFSVDFSQDGGGKLTGAGSTSITVHSDVIYGTIPNATYKVSGSIKSKGGVATLRYSATATAMAAIDGRQRSLSVTGSETVTLDARYGLLTGTYKNKASASGLGGGKDTGPIPQTWADVAPYLGNGGWELSLDLANDGVKKIDGTATVMLNSGAGMAFSVKGSYNAKTDISKLVLSPPPSVKGSSLKVTMLGDSITAIQGKVSGQSIKLVVP
jgi:hypothetical protein